MTRIVTLTGRDRDLLLAHLHSEPIDAPIHTIRLAVEHNEPGVKVKVNEGAWSYGLGTEPDRPAVPALTPALADLLRAVNDQIGSIYDAYDLAAKRNEQTAADLHESPALARMLRESAESRRQTRDHLMSLWRAAADDLDALTVDA